jgi:hypothetical protein
MPAVLCAARDLFQNALGSTSSGPLPGRPPLHSPRLLTRGDAVADCGEKLLDVEWLSELAADCGALKVLDGLRCGGREDDDALPGRVLFLQMVDDVEAADAGHHEVENDRVVERARQRFESLGSVGCDVDIVTVSGEHGSKKRTNPVVIIYDEDSTGRIRSVDGGILRAIRDSRHTHRLSSLIRNSLRSSTPQSPPAARPRATARRPIVPSHQALT